jgi:hypothetical protein
MGRGADFFVIDVFVKHHGGLSEAVRKLGRAPSRPLMFQGFRRFRSEPVPFFHRLDAKKRAAQRKMRQVVYSGGSDRYRSGNE